MFRTTRRALTALARSLEAAQAERTAAAVQQVRAGERNLGPAPVVTVAAQRSRQRTAVTWTRWPSCCWA